MSGREIGQEVLSALLGRGHRVAEVYLKRGRSRRVLFEAGRWTVSSASEEGWAVRAGDDGRSFLAAGTGTPPPQGEWPAPRAPGLRLPGPAPARWRPPADLAQPVMAESEGRALLADLASRLERELRGARLVQGQLEEGISEISLANSRGVAAWFRTRAASLYVEGLAGEVPPVRANLQVAARTGGELDGGAIAGRLADLLRIRQGLRQPLRDRGDFLLAPAVGAALLQGLLPLWLGPEASARARSLLDRSGRLASPHWTLVDDGRLRGGVLEAPVDGEGFPTGSVVLVEEGAFRQPLLSWRQAQPPAEVASGCVGRPGWRDAPGEGPTHLYLRPDPEVSVADLLAEVSRGYYLLEPAGGGAFRVEEDELELPVEGLQLARGRAVGPVTGAVLKGRVSALLRGLRGVARDLRFSPLGAMIGSPTLLVSGLEIVRR